MKTIGLSQVIVCLMASASPAAEVTSLSDIQFWTGAGENRAALAIDWFGDDEQDAALVWGFRWDGIADGESMLREVLAADGRLFAKLSAPGPLGIAAYGFGYDETGDQHFAIDDGTAFDADGVAVSQPTDGAESLDAGDRYREGWYDGYWHFATGVSGVAGPVWETAGSGPTQQTLADGDWHSYAFALTLDADEFAENLIAAAPPAAPGDFNGDGVVDSADYTVWRDTLGDVSSYRVWRENYGSLAPEAIANSTPEPPLVAACALVLLLSPHLAVGAETRFRSELSPLS